MVTQIALGDTVIDVIQKDIKNVHLSVYPPNGKVRISAPLRMKTDTIRVFALSKLGWIRQQQQKLRAQERETPREYLDRESHYVWGERYLLEIVEARGLARVELKHSKMVLHVRPGANEAKKQQVVELWYREQLAEAIPPLIAKWEPVIGVRVNEFQVRRMKTRWGNCSPTTSEIRINPELAKKPRECLEYIVVHEMVHLLEPNHKSHFVALMDGFMPQWRSRRALLNRLPLPHERWKY